MIPRLHVPLLEPEDVVRHLGKQEKHWKEGRSAHALAKLWSDSNALPPRIEKALKSHSACQSAGLVDAFLERQVDLKTAGRHSQTDLLAVVGLENGIAIVAVEGKAGEKFGDRVDEWLDGSDSRKVRLAGLCETLGLTCDAAKPLRYQLLHRSASAVYEAKRYRTKIAAMLVHSFAEDEEGFKDFAAFVRTLGLDNTSRGNLVGPVSCEGVDFYAGWIQDDAPRGTSPSAYLDDLRNYASKLAEWCKDVRGWCDERQSKT